MEEIFRHIRNAFDALWHMRPRGNSFEVITPFPADDKYVSVFVTQQRDKYVVTDGGWISDGVYNIGKDAPELSKTFERIMDYFLADFNILRTKTMSGRVICFKSTTDPKFIPNLVFEVANFVSIVSSMALVPLKDEVEKRNDFRQRTSKFILDAVGQERLIANSALSADVPAAKFNAIVELPSKKKVLINYVTGSTTEYMMRSYYKSNAMFDLLRQDTALSRLKKSVKHEIVVMDDEARGYQYELLFPFLGMSESKGQTPIKWSTGKRKLAGMLN